MAALAPAAAIDGNETSFSLPVSRRKVSSACPAPQMRISRAFEFGRVLARLHRDDRILGQLAGAAGLFQDRGELGWRRGGIEQDFLAVFAKNLEIARETFRLFNISEAR